MQQLGQKTWREGVTDVAQAKMAVNIQMWVQERAYKSTDWFHVAQYGV